MLRHITPFFGVLLVAVSPLVMACLGPEGPGGTSSTGDGKTDCQGPLCEGGPEACVTCTAVFDQCWAWVPEGSGGALCVEEFAACAAEASLAAFECAPPDPQARDLCDECRALYLDCAAVSDGGAEGCEAELALCVEAAGLDPAGCAAPTEAQVGRCTRCRADRAGCAELSYVCDDWFYGCVQALGLGRTCHPSPAD